MSTETQNDVVQQFEAIQTEVTRLAKQATTFSGVVRRLSRADGFGNLKRLDRDLAQLDGLNLGNEALRRHAAAAASQARAWLSDEWQRRAAEFASELEVYLSNRAIPATATSSSVATPPLVIMLDAQRDRGQLMYAGESVGKAQPLSAPLLYRSYTDCLALLERQQTPPEAFADELIDAYRDACRQREVRPGGRVRLPDVHFMLFVRRQTAAVRSDPRRGRIKEYPRYQFAWDVELLRRHSEWLKRPAGRIDLHPASATAAKGRAESLRLVQADGSEVVVGDMQVVGR
ncbi:MAG: hypothetical protein AB1634_09590 [Thermodesulfobacteriota bacterium]